MSSAKKQRPAASAQSSDSNTAQEHEFMQIAEDLLQKAQALAGSDLSPEEREERAQDLMIDLDGLVASMPVEEGKVNVAINAVKDFFATFKQAAGEQAGHIEGVKQALDKHTSEQAGHIEGVKQALDKQTSEQAGHIEKFKRAASEQAGHIEKFKQAAMGIASPAKLQELKQATQAAFSDSMAWHETEERLLTCISKPRVAELDQEIERLRTLRRTAIGAGQAGGKDYKQLGTLIAATESERADLDIVAGELEQGALDRAVVGQGLWHAHSKQRRELAEAYLQAEIGASKLEARAALLPALPLLAKLAVRIEQRRNILDALGATSEGSRPDFSLAAPVSDASVGEVCGLLAAMILSGASKVDAGFDQEIMAEVKRCPPSNLIRGDLVGSRAKKIQNLKLQKMQREPKPKPSSAQQRAADNWSFEKMKSRYHNVR